MAADTLAAWITAHVEAQRLGESDQESVRVHFVNTLVLSYLLAAFVFDARTKSEKRQRALGLITSALLVQAKNSGTLNEDCVNEVWEPTTPILALNIEESGTFNGILVNTLAGLVFADREVDFDTALALWNSVGESPVQRSMDLAALLLRQLNVI